MKNFKLLRIQLRYSESVNAGALHDGLVFGNFGRDLGLGLIPELEVSAFLLVVDAGLDLALGLQSGDDVLVFPPHLVRQTAQDAELAMRLNGGDGSLKFKINSQALGGMK